MRSGPRRTYSPNAGRLHGGAIGSIPAVGRRWALALGGLGGVGRRGTWRSFARGPLGSVSASGEPSRGPARHARAGIEIAAPVGETSQGGRDEAGAPTTRLTVLGRKYATSPRSGATFAPERRLGAPEQRHLGPGAAPPAPRSGGSALYGGVPSRDTSRMTTSPGAHDAPPLPGARPVRAPRGTAISCRGWQQEAVLRMLMNNLDPEVAENPDALVVYGGTGRAARSWDGLRRDRAGAPCTRRRRDAPRPVGQAGRRLPDEPVGAARADRELQPRREVGDLGALPRAREGRPDDVRPDDGGLLDLHRDPGDPPGHLRDVRGAGAPALRRHPAGARGPHRRPGRHGRRPAALGDDERRGRDRHRGRRVAGPPAPRDRLRRPADGLAGRGARDGPPRGRPGRAALDRPRRQRRRDRARSGRRRASASTQSPTRPRPTTHSAGTCRPR